MNGFFGANPSDDGAFASTGSSDRSGIFARNDSVVPAASGTPGGNGVFGLTTVPNRSGVFGASNGRSGTGVTGICDGGDGMQAVTKSSSFSGIFARNDSREAAPEGKPAGNGVFGLSTVPNASGVFGVNNNGGNGAAGFSRDGVGVWGAGGRLAGQFVGDVEVSGRLVVGGLDVGALVSEIGSLHARVASLSAQVNGLSAAVAGLSVNR